MDGGRVGIFSIQLNSSALYSATSWLLRSSNFEYDTSGIDLFSVSVGLGAFWKKDLVGDLFLESLMVLEFVEKSLKGSGEDLGASA